MRLSGDAAGASGSALEDPCGSRPRASPREHPTALDSGLPGVLAEDAAGPCDHGFSYANGVLELDFSDRFQ